MDKTVIDGNVVKVWEKSIDVQIHFNDLIMRNRTIVTSLITTVFGFAAFLLKDVGKTIAIHQCHVSVVSIIIIVGVLFLLAYAVLDFCYYLPLLLGAVNFTLEMDEKFSELGLSKSISNSITGKRAKKTLLFFYALLIIPALVIALIMWN